MVEKMLFTLRENWKKEILEARKQKKIITLNFMNSHDLYFFTKDSFFRESIKNNMNFVDGFVVSVFLSLSNLKKIERFSGTEFMIDFFNDKALSSGKHLFIGSEKDDLKILVKKFPHLKKKNLFCYNPPYIKETRFPEKEIKKIAKNINSKKIDFVWVGLGCPKQYILAYDLSKKTKNKIFINAGAAMDFVLEKKKKAPKIFLKTGTEWFYRLITDFNHSKKKVWRSFVSLPHLNKVKLK